MQSRKVREIQTGLGISLQPSRIVIEFGLPKAIDFLQPVLIISAVVCLCLNLNGRRARPQQQEQLTQHHRSSSSFGLPDDN
jgi:hypothetical protein